VIKIILAVIATEAITEILVESALFEDIRCRLAAKHDLLAEFVQCGWCISVWVGAAAFAVILLRLEVIFIPFVIARLANFAHDLFGIAKRLKWRE